MQLGLVIAFVFFHLINSACFAAITAQSLSANLSYTLDDQSVTKAAYDQYLRPSTFSSVEDKKNKTKEPKGSPFPDGGPNVVMASYSQYRFFVGKVFSDPVTGAGDSSVTFTAVANSIWGWQSSDWVGFLPINMAYGASSNHVWIQMAIIFKPGGAADLMVEQNNYNGGADYDYGTYANGREWATSFPWPQNIGVPYTVGHTYHFSIFDTDSTHVQVNIVDDTSGGSWAKTIAVPSTNLLYWPDPGGFSPAATVEGVLALSVTSLSDFPYFQFDVTHYMQSVYATMYSTKGSGAPSNPPSGVSQFLSKTFPHSWWVWAAVSSSSNIPTPAIDSVTMNPSGSITLGQSFSVDVYVRNAGTRTSSWTTIQISFPTNPSTSAISISGSSTIGSATIYPVGYRAPAGYGFRIGGGSAFTYLQYPFAEGSSAISPGSSKLLRVTVTPPSAGTFRFYVKSVAAYSDRAVVWTPNPDTVSTRDQQSEYVYEYTKIVNYPNQLPTAYIDSISPNPATQGQSVSFSGHGTDPDGSVVGYNWRSSIDGQLSTSSSFSTSSLSVGTHTIYFKVQDNSGAWSTEATATLTINLSPPSNQKPWASIVSPSGWVRGTITLTATAGDPDGYVTRVRFIWTPDKSNGPFYVIGDDTNSADGWSISWDCGGPSNNDASVWVAAVALDNGGLESDWSWSNQFGVDHAVPSTPTLSSPASGTSTTNTKPTFVWNPATDSPSGVASYTLQLDTSTAFNSGNLRTIAGIASTSYTPTSPLSGGTWYWRVQAKDNAGNEGSYSSYWSVIIQVTETYTVTLSADSTNPSIYQKVTFTGRVTSNVQPGGVPNVQPALSYQWSGGGSGSWSATKTDANGYFYAYWTPQPADAGRTVSWTASYGGASSSAVSITVKTS